MLLKKTNLCINGLLIYNVNSLEYYENLVKKGLIKENKENEILENKLKNYVKIDNTNFYKNQNVFYNDLNLEKKYSKNIKIKLVFKEDLINICDDIIYICKILNFNEFNKKIVLINGYKIFFKNKKINKYNKKILNTVEHIINYINEIKEALMFNKNLATILFQADFEKIYYDLLELKKI